MESRAIDLTLRSTDVPERWIAIQAKHSGINATADALDAFRTTLAAFRTQLFDVAQLAEIAWPSAVSVRADPVDLIVGPHWTFVNWWSAAPSHYYYAHGFLHRATHALSASDLEELDHVLSEIDDADEGATFESYVTYLWNTLRDRAIPASRRAWAWRAWRALVFGIRMPAVHQLVRHARRVAVLGVTSPVTQTRRYFDLEELAMTIVRTGPPASAPSADERCPDTSSEVLAARPPHCSGRASPSGTFGARRGRLDTARGTVHLARDDHSRCLSGLRFRLEIRHTHSVGPAYRSSNRGNLVSYRPFARRSPGTSGGFIYGPVRTEGHAARSARTAHAALLHCGGSHRMGLKRRRQDASETVTQ